MSFEAMAWAHAQKVPDSECKLILLMLANRSATHETDSNICWPSIGQISEDCLLSETTIRQRLKTLRELRLVTWIHRNGPDGNATSHLFTLPVTPLRAANPPPCRANGGTSPHAPPPTSPGEPETVSTETVSTETVIEPSRRESAGNPSLFEVLATANMIGLSEWKARDWFDEMEGCGWLDFQHRPVVRWQSILNRVKVKWEADGRPDSPPHAKTPPSRAGQRPLSVLDLKTVIAAKEARCVALKGQHCTEGPLTNDWNDDNARADFVKLRREIKKLNADLSQMA